MSLTNIIQRVLHYRPSRQIPRHIFAIQRELKGDPLVTLPRRRHQLFLNPSLRQYHPNALNIPHRHHHSYARILGIETSCDDTGVAIIDTNGVILAESLFSQSEFHTKMGGVNPSFARELHAANISKAVDEVFHQSGLTPADLSAIAVTTRPGLFVCLNEGLSHARKMAIEARLPLLPIHHMEAHALTPRLGLADDDSDGDDHLRFPFLVLLISGGHCILSLVRGVSDFLLLGNCQDQAPGDLFDKAARRLKLLNLPECRRLSGGRAIEKVASSGGDPSRFPMSHVMLNKRDCNFSFSGLHAHVHHIIEKEEERLEIMGGDVLPNAPDITAALQVGVAKHLAMRLVRAFNYCDLKQLLPDEGRQRRLVMSGGVAANGFLRSVIQRVCEQHDAQLVCPPPKLCTDNGVMIAWNGIERWKAGDRGVSDITDIENIVPVPKSPLGQDVGDDIFRASLRVRTKDIDVLVEGTDSVLRNSA